MADRDDALAARQAIESVWERLERSLLLNVAAVRTFAWSSRARCAIAAAARSPHVREADEAIRAEGIREPTKMVRCFAPAIP